MNSLRALKNSELHEGASRLVDEERRITLAVLEHFREIERRKSYSDLGCRSLFEYAVKQLRYSEGSASRRIAAMFALKENPELGTRIRDGEVNVSAVARIQTTIRRDEKLTGRKWESEDKKRVFKELGSLPSKDLENKLVLLAPEAAVQETVRPVTSELHEVKIYLTIEDLRALEELRANIAHSMNQVGSNSELIQKLIRGAKEKLESERERIGKSQTKDHSGAMVLKKTNTPDQVTPPRRDASPIAGAEASRVSSATRRLVFRRADYRCEFRHSDGQKCDSRFFLQIEHRRPRALGGTNEAENLELLCRDHNFIRGIQIFGEKKMRRG